MPAKPSKVDLILAVPLFRGLSRAQAHQVARLADEVEVRAGKRLATLGETGRELFIIVEGTAAVRTPRGRTIRLSPGEFVGEMSLLDGGPRSADVEALTDMRLLVIGQRDFWSLLEAAPQIARQIMRTLSARLREAEQQVTA